LQSGDFLYNEKDCGDDFGYTSSIIGNARSRALEFKPFLIGHTQYLEVKEEDRLKKNSQFELHNKTYHNLLTGLIISDTGKKAQVLKSRLSMVYSQCICIPLIFGFRVTFQNISHLSHRLRNSHICGFHYFLILCFEL